MESIVFLQDLFLPKEAARGLLEERGGRFEVVWPGDVIDHELRGRVALLVTSEHKVDADVLAPWPNLKMLSLAFTGYDRVDLDYCRTRGIAVYYVPDYSSDSVAELAVGLTLALLRKLPKGDQSVRGGHWDQSGMLHGSELHGRRVGILGTGKIGVKTALLFKAFGCQVLGWSRTRRREFLAVGEYTDGLDDLFSRSDVIVLHLPGTAETRHIVGAQQIALMKRSAVLVNVARGQLVDTRALVKAVAERQILGAALDVYEDEPPPLTAALLSLDNVVLSPHLGFKTKEALDRLARLTIGNVNRFLSGDRENRLL